MTGGHERDFLALRVAVLHAVEEGANGRRTPPRLPGSLSHEPPNHGGALASDMPKAIPFSGLVLPSNKAKVTTHGFRVSETMGIIDERCQGFCRSSSDPRDAPQLAHGMCLLRTAI